MDPGSTNDKDDGTEKSIITFKTLSGKQFSVQVPVDILIRDLKSQISQESGLADSRMRLIYRGRVLKDSFRLSADEHVESGHVIHIVESRPPPASANPPVETAPETQIPRPRNVFVRTHVLRGFQTVTTSMLDRLKNDINRILNEVRNQHQSPSNATDSSNQDSTTVPEPSRPDPDLQTTNSNFTSTTDDQTIPNIQHPISQIVEFFSLRNGSNAFSETPIDFVSHAPRSESSTRGDQPFPFQASQPYQSMGINNFAEYINNLETSNPGNGFGGVHGVRTDTSSRSTNTGEVPRVGVRITRSRSHSQPPLTNTNLPNLENRQSLATLYNRFIQLIFTLTRNELFDRIDPNSLFVVFRTIAEIFRQFTLSGFRPALESTLQLDLAPLSVNLTVLTHSNVNQANRNNGENSTANEPRTADGSPNPNISGFQILQSFRNLPFQNQQQQNANLSQNNTSHQRQSSQFPVANNDGNNQPEIFNFAGFSNQNNRTCLNPQSSAFSRPQGVFRQEQQSHVATSNTEANSSRGANNHNDNDGGNNSNGNASADLGNNTATPSSANGDNIPVNFSINLGSFFMPDIPDFLEDFSQGYVDSLLSESTATASSTSNGPSDPRGSAPDVPNSTPNIQQSQPANDSNRSDVLTRLFGNIRNGGIVMTSGSSTNTTSDSCQKADDDAINDGTGDGDQKHNPDRLSQSNLSFFSTSSHGNDSHPAPLVNQSLLNGLDNVGRSLVNSFSSALDRHSVNGLHCISGTISEYSSVENSDGNGTNEGATSLGTDDKAISTIKSASNAKVDNNEGDVPQSSTSMGNPSSESRLDHFYQSFPAANRGLNSVWNSHCNESEYPSSVDVIKSMFTTENINALLDGNWGALKTALVSIVREWKRYESSSICNDWIKATFDKNELLDLYPSISDLFFDRVRCAFKDIIAVVYPLSVEQGQDYTRTLNFIKDRLVKLVDCLLVELSKCGYMENSSWPYIVLDQFFGIYKFLPIYIRYAINRFIVSRHEILAGKPGWGSNNQRVTVEKHLNGFGKTEIANHEDSFDFGDVEKDESSNSSCFPGADGSLPSVQWDERVIERDFERQKEMVLKKMLSSKSNRIVSAEKVLKSHLDTILDRPRRQSFLASSGDDSSRNAQFKEFILNGISPELNEMYRKQLKDDVSKYRLDSDVEKLIPDEKRKRLFDL